MAWSLPLPVGDSAKRSLLARLVRWLRSHCAGRVPSCVYAEGTPSWCHVPPTLPNLAALISMVYRIPYVLLINDMYPETPIACGLMKEQSLVYRMLRRINRSCFEAGLSDYHNRAGHATKG